MFRSCAFMFEHTTKILYIRINGTFKKEKVCLIFLTNIKNIEVNGTVHFGRESSMYRQVVISQKNQ